MVEIVIILIGTWAELNKFVPSGGGAHFWPLKIIYKSEK